MKIIYIKKADHFWALFSKSNVQLVWAKFYLEVILSLHPWLLCTWQSRRSRQVVTELWQVLLISVQAARKKRPLLCERSQVSVVKERWDLYFLTQLHRQEAAFAEKEEKHCKPIKVWPRRDGEKHEEKGKFYILDKKTQIGVLGLFVKTNEKQVISGWDSQPSGWWGF